MKFCSLGSGSKGNATIVQENDTVVMIDCGFALKHTVARLKEKSLEPEQVNAILVTHEHGDHIGGVSRFAKKYKTPVYLTAGTARSSKVESVVTQRRIAPDDAFTVGDLFIQSVTVPHDAREPCQFLLKGADKTLGVLTDLGSVSSHVQQAFSQCDALLLEANHDVDLLMEGPYPPSLKRRVAGDWGHLNNEQALAFLTRLARPLDTLVLGHVSEQNNCPDRVKQTFNQFEGVVRQLHYATQSSGFDWLYL